MPWMARAGALSLLEGCLVQPRGLMWTRSHDMDNTLSRAPQAQASNTGTSAARAMLLPLILAQFVCSYAGTNMNVAINDIAKDLGTTVSGVQTAITIFTLTMAALMIPGSKLTDIWGRK